MPAQKKTASSLFTAVVGTLGFSALAGFLVTVMIAPALAVTGITANNTIGIFESLPEYLTIDNQHQQNLILAKNADGTGLPHRLGLRAEPRRGGARSDERQPEERGGRRRRPALLRPRRHRHPLGRPRGARSDSPRPRAVAPRRSRCSWCATSACKRPSTSRASATSSARKDINAATYPDLGRKLQEMKYAIGLEKKYSKQTILAAYLNIVGMGGNTYGVQAAAQQYFGTTAAKVTLAQAASLIAIVQNPTHNGLFSPKNYQNNQDRRHVILAVHAHRALHHRRPSTRRRQAPRSTTSSCTRPSRPRAACMPRPATSSSATTWSTAS